MSSKLSDTRVSFAYCGLPLGALALAREGFMPRVIVLGHTDAPGARRVRAMSRDVMVLGQPDLADAGVRRAIESVAADALLSWFYPKQIPASLLRTFPRGAFGAHPSLLPRWRGPDPYFWALFTGDQQTGVSLHRLEAEYDTGDVIAQESLIIDERDDGFRLAKRLDRPSLRLLLSCARRLCAGEALRGEPQDDRWATAAPRPDADMLEIAWEQPAAQVVRLIRAAAPYPGASCELGEEVVDVLDASVYPRSLPRALEPYDAVLTPSGVVVCAGDGGVVIRRVRREDGSELRGNGIAQLFAEGLTHVHFDPKRAK